MITRRLLGTATTTTALACAYRFNQPARAETAQPVYLMPEVGPKIADTILAGVGLFGSCTTLSLLERILARPLFAPPMMASGIIFFAGPSPPDPKGFLGGTMCAATISYMVLYMLSPRFPAAVAQGAAAAALLMWYKTTSTIFPPIAALAGALIAAAPSSGLSLVSKKAYSLQYLAFPWLAGHAWLYGCAYAMSILRSQTRVAITKGKMLSLGEQSDQELRVIFEKFDTSGDGSLDADELKVALRVALGTDLSREDCEQLVSAADKDGTCTVDFDEFKAICKGHL